MSFGKLGAMGRGFGHLGALGTAQLPAAPAGFGWVVYSDRTGVQHIETYTLPSGEIRPLMMRLAA